MAEVVEMVNIGESFTIQHDGWGHLLQSLVTTEYNAFTFRLGRHWVRGEGQVVFFSIVLTYIHHLLKSWSVWTKKEEVISIG